MRMTDFTPWSRSSIGFDRLFDLLESSRQFDSSENYLPYNIEKTNEDAYRLTLAVAGFSAEELSITAQPNQLIVGGRATKNAEGQYLYRGIARRAFERRFNLADYVKVTNASLQNGILAIDLAREMPEATKPRRIAIANGNQVQTVGAAAA